MFIDIQLVLAGVLAITFVPQFVHLQCLTENDEDQSLNPLAKSNLYTGEQEFTISLLNAINDATPNENVFFSPYSTYHALLLAYFGARNKTEDELKKALNLGWTNNKHHVLQAYRFESQLRARRAEKNTEVEFKAADKIFLPKDAPLENCIKSLLYEEIETKDFVAEPEKCRLEINQWVENTTKSQIKDILNEGDISSDTKVVLANAAYFKGLWVSKFDSSDTKRDVFFTAPDEPHFVNMMQQKGMFHLGISESLCTHILSMPYNGSDISMIILLPPFVANSLENVLSKLSAESLKEALNDLMAREIIVKLPKFSFEQTIELTPILRRLGINELFSSSSDLSGFTKHKNLAIDGARHKAKIEVDEEGSTAAAATVLFTFRSARPVDPTTFICNHPFVFLIYDSKSEAILFAGIYRKPEELVL